jgi:hypothetical protein
LSLQGVVGGVVFKISSASRSLYVIVDVDVVVKVNLGVVGGVDGLREFGCDAHVGVWAQRCHFVDHA